METAIAAGRKQMISMLKGRPTRNGTITEMLLVLVRVARSRRPTLKKSKLLRIKKVHRWVLMGKIREKV